MSSSLFRACAIGLVLLPIAACSQTPVQTAIPTNDPANNAATRTLDRAAGIDSSGAYPAQADGTAVNPRGTVVSRAARRVTRHTTNRKAQTVRNNSATRGVDRAAGTNTSGAYPAQSDGKPGNPKGTAVSRTLGTTNN